MSTSSPVAGFAEVGARRLIVLGVLGAAEALGLVLIADAIASGVVTVIAHGDVGPAVLEGLAGALVRAIATWGLRVVSQSAAAGVKQALRLRLARVFLGSEKGGVGADAALAATGLDDLDAYYTSYLPSLVSAATVPVLVGVRILTADWVSALIIVVTIPLVPFFMALIGLHTRDRVAASLDALGRLSDHLVELARGLPVLVGLGRDREQARALQAISDDHRVRSMTALRTAFLSSLALDLTATISVALVAVVIGVRLLRGELGLEAGLVALILAPECFARLRDVGAAFHASDLGREALRRVSARVTQPVPTSGLARREGTTIAVHGLRVIHSGRTRPAVSRLSFRAPTHGVTLLAGDSGAGKSTVLAVLAGRGPLTVPGAECTGRITAPALHKVAWMPQHPHFSSRTVADEVALYARSDATLATASDTLARLGLAHLAPCDPAELSPGEARRLAFARVLAAVDAGAELALLDEPTAHLDVDAAARIRTEILAMRERATVIVASHDPLVRPIAERVVHVGVASLSPAVAPAGAAPDGERPAAGESQREVDRNGEDQPVRMSGSVDGAHHGPVAELLAFLRPVAWRLSAAAIVGALSTAFAIALIAVSGWLIVRASDEPAIMYLLVAIVGVRFFGIGRSVLRYAERLITHDAVFRATTGLRMRLWAALALAGPAGRRALSPANALASLIGSADRVRDLVPRVLLPPVTAAVVVAGAAVTLGLLFAPALAVAIAIAVIGLGIAPALAAVTGRLAARAAERARSSILTGFTDLLVARDDLTALAADRVLRRIDDTGSTAAREERRLSYSEGAASALVVLACAAAAVLILPLAAPAVASGALAGELVAVLVLVPLAMIEPLSDAVAAASRAPALAGVLGSVSAVTGVRPAVVEGSTVAGPERAAAATRAVHGIRLDRVSFSYQDSSRPVFADVDAHVRRGQWLAVTGPSGSGKSTLLALLLRFADPDSGRYLLETGAAASSTTTIDARCIPPHSLRARVAWCPQDGHLFDSTLRANLTIARKRDDRPTDAELTDALSRVGLAPLLTALPDGLDTRIGPAGERLSGGQRQRVAVARTLLAGGDVVLIDEPTAHLDEQASRALIADLRDALRERTTVLVTHDASEVADADHVIRLGAAEGRDLETAA